MEGRKKRAEERVSVGEREREREEKRRTRQREDPRLHEKNQRPEEKKRDGEGFEAATATVDAALSVEPPVPVQTYLLLGHGLGQHRFAHLCHFLHEARALHRRVVDGMAGRGRPLGRRRILHGRLGHAGGRRVCRLSTFDLVLANLNLIQEIASGAKGKRGGGREREQQVSAQAEATGRQENRRPCRVASLTRLRECHPRQCSRSQGRQARP